MGWPAAKHFYAPPIGIVYGSTESGYTVNYLIISKCLVRNMSVLSIDEIHFVIVHVRIPGKKPTVMIILFHSRTLSVHTEPLTLHIPFIIQLNANNNSSAATTTFQSNIVFQTTRFTH